MYRQIIHEHDVAPFESWDRTLFDISKKHRPVHGAFDHKGGGHSTLPQAAYEGDCFPRSMRCVVDKPLAAQCPSAQPHHRGIRTGFVDEHQSRRVKHALFAHPAPTRASHVRALLLRRVQSFF